MSESVITVDGFSVKVVRKKIKNIHLAICPPDGWVRIAVPEMTEDEAVRLAVVSRLAWVKRQKKSFEDQVRQSARELITRESHYYLGQRYLLDICQINGSPYIELKNKKTMVLNVNKKTSKEQREQLLMNWYRKEIKKIVPSTIKKWEIITGLSVGDYGIKRMKTKWGSCNPSKKRIWLNLELVKKPVCCLEYIIVHEMVHFLIHTHNDKFIGYMDKFMPQWRTYRDELNQSPLVHENWDY